MHKVVVLMSTYNGEKYLEAQIDSILKQRNVNVYLLIRDDGSTDSTLNVIDHFSRSGKLTVYGRDNLGAAKSFIDLIFSAPESEYYAFSDQDDIWEVDKLTTAIDRIKDKSGPAVYHGLAGRVDESLSPLPTPTYTPMHSFGASLLTSATGCTMVFNKAMMDALRVYKPNNISMHDAWVYRVAYAIDAFVYYDAETHMKYRQHSNNVSGGDMGLSEKIKRQLVNNKSVRLITAMELRTGYYEIMSETNKEIINKFIIYKKNLWHKLCIITDKRYELYSAKTNIQNKLLFLMGKI